MYSNVFQLSNEPIKDRLDYSWYSVLDSCRSNYLINVTGEDRQKAINDLLRKTLSDLVFEKQDDDCYIYRSGKENLAKRISLGINSILSSNKFTADDILSVGYDLSKYRVLQSILLNPLRTDAMFVQHSEYCGGEKAGRSNELLSFVSELKAGDKMYIGGIVEYRL